MDNSSPVKYAQKYTEDILSFFGLNVDVQVTEDDEVIHVSIPSTEYNGFLIGSAAETMRALQALVSSALRNQGFEKSRVNLDVADYKKQRAEKLTVQAEAWVKQVIDTGTEMALEPMNAADRRTVHQLASERGLDTQSVGERYERHIVLKIKE